MRRWLRAFSAVAMCVALSKSYGGEPSEKASEESKWDVSLSASVYLAENGRDYVNPGLTANYDWLHFEARYNYEAFHTGSLWLGYNFSFGKELAIVITPMFGGVFGDIDGVAPGYTITASYKSFAFFTQGEYFFDSESHDENFFYNWSELSYSPTSWCRFGLVLDRTKALGDNFDIRRGPLLGFNYKKMNFTAYWLDPGAHDSTVVLSAGVSF